jgi:hypothetical protein
MAGGTKPKLVKTYDLSKKKHKLHLSCVELYAAEQERPAQLRKVARPVTQKFTDNYWHRIKVHFPISCATVIRVHAGGDTIYDVILFTSVESA